MGQISDNAGPDWCVSRFQVSGPFYNRRLFLGGAAATAAIPFPLASSGEANRFRPNIVLILVDQLRKDYADRYMPRVNKLVAGGWRLDGMRSVAPWTYPSVLSLMSGLYPQQHGAQGHLALGRLSIFDEKIPLLQQTLSESGYRTAGFVTNPFLHTWNPFHVGFDKFDISFINSIGVSQTDHSAFTNRMYANTVNRAIENHFDGSRPTDPEFTYIHYIDVHGPWNADPPFRPTYKDSVKYIDHQIERMYQMFMHRYQGDVIFIVTSDHGRALFRDVQLGDGRHWRKNKMSIHEFNLSIPFAILPSRHVHEPRIVEGLCSNVDLASTLYDWLDIGEGHDSPGESLLPSLMGKEELDPERIVYAHHEAFRHHSDCIIHRGRKYARFFNVYRRREVGRRVWDIENDPGETESLTSDFGEAERLFADAAGGHGIVYEPNWEVPSAETTGKLRALGYLQ